MDINQIEKNQVVSIEGKTGEVTSIQRHKGKIYVSLISRHYGKRVYNKMCFNQSDGEWKNDEGQVLEFIN